MARAYKHSSHDDLSHDSIESFGYDWDRAAKRDIKPKFPLKIYLPQTTEDIVEIMQECRSLGQKLVIRSKGHSSNDLVLVEKGAVLTTQKLDQILELNEEAMTVTVQSGVVLADLDLYLAKRGLGLPIVGDHNDITAGGFASVGGFSPASLRYGMFIDNVTRLEYVTWEGEIVSCSRDDKPEEFFRVIAGTGQYGVISKLECRVMRVNKLRTLVRNDQKNYRKLDEFVRDTTAFIADQGDAVMQRIVWFDFGLLKMGQLSRYVEAPTTATNALRDKVAFTYLHRLGRWSGRLPERVDSLLKFVGIAGVMFPPRYGTIKHVETLTDMVLESSVGDPIRMLAVIAPEEKYETIFRGLYDLCLSYRKRYKCFSFISIYVKALNSEYLDGLRPGTHFCELLLYLGVKPAGMTDEVLEQLVSDLDDLCISHGAYRYMHTKTVKDPERRKLIDPNATRAGQISPVGVEA